jgi:hypothetical protein
MVSLELLQLIHTDADLMMYAEELNLEDDETSDFFSDPGTRFSFAQTVLRSSKASQFLKEIMDKVPSP